MSERIGFIGLGIMGDDHANIIQSKVSNAKVTSVYDKNINQAQRIIETLDNPEIHNSGLELINSNKVDAVMVVSPDDTHVEFVLECIKLHKPVLCEKPLSHSVKECNDVIEAEQKIIDVEDNISENRSNDGASDALGRLWFGTMQNNFNQDGSARSLNAKSGSLYCLSDNKLNIRYEIELGKKVSSRTKSISKLKIILPKNVSNEFSENITTSII